MLRDEVKSKVQTFNFTTPDLFKTIWSSVDRSMNSIVQHPKLLFSWILFLYNIGVYYMYQFLKKIVSSSMRSRGTTF